jgi:hypothetical protein
MDAMTSRIEDSLEFLSEQLESSSNDFELSVREIRDRAFTLRSSYRSATPSEDLTHSRFTEPNNRSTGAGEVFGPSSRESSQDFCPPLGVSAAGIHQQLPPLPCFPGVDQDALRNLLMSWFYVGYYSAKSELSRAETGS